MTTAQPISFTSAEAQDFPMGSGSFTGANGSFNASSYTRHLIGSPLSFRGGSFGSRFYPGMSPGQLLGPLDPNDFKFGKMSSSIESDRGSIVNALHVFDRQDELARDYTCCGLNLNDLHALVDHFEECHVVVLDPFSSHPSLPQTLPTSTAPQAVASYFPDSNGVPSGSTQPSSQSQQQSISYQGFDPDDMELDVDQNASAPSSGAPSPPDTPVSTPLSSYPAYSHSALPSPALAHASQPASPISAFDTTTVLPSRAHHMSGFRSSASPAASAARAEDAFNAYAGYSDYSSLLPGATPLGGAANAMFMQQQSQLANMSLGPMNGNQASCAPTALLLSNSAANTPDSTPASSRVASPIPSGSTTYRNVAPSGSQGVQSTSSTAGPSNSGASNAANSSTPRASTTLSRPASSLLLSKPFRCPKPNCNKSYKQANGLKYHMTHGSCNFAPPKDLEHLQELLASKRSEKAAKAGENGPASEAEVTLSDAELREVEKEAERRLRPYACGVGDCQRRYKNMNGLRTHPFISTRGHSSQRCVTGYHYQHSGDHGAIGLALLASGQHECLQHNKSHSRHATPSQSATASQPQTSPRSPSSQASFAQQQSSFSHPPTYQSATMSPPTYAYQSSPSQQYAQQAQVVQQAQQQYSQPQQVQVQQPQPSSHFSTQGYSMALPQ
ncbi:hypothetical protein C8Q78DRAFT_1053104 [Trametes maxima]|nr:hypothetical protein C8Q78DRAFT_1053104 [Trametes maxima]